MYFFTLLSISHLLMIHTFKSDLRLMLLTTIVKRQKDSRTRTKRFKIQEHLRAVLQFISILTFT